MKHANLSALLLLAILWSMSSCKSHKDFVYLQDMEQGIGYPYDVKREAVVHINDRLAITVSSKNPELATPFNSTSYQVSSTTGEVSTQLAPTTTGYRVDLDGNIQFPILGSLHVDGLKVSQVTDLIRNRIIEGKYIKDPLVTLSFLNFRYTVLGAAGSTGVYNVDDGRVTLLEAIAKAGDVSANGRVDRVHVIREEGGERIEYTHDLRSKDLFLSPCYYLQQNDIVYVEPKKKSTNAGEKVWRYVTGIASLVSSICYIYWVTKD